MKIAELEVLVQQMDLDPLKSTHIISPGYTHLANLTEVIAEDPRDGRGRCIAMLPIAWSDGLAALRNHAEKLIAVAKAARRVSVSVPVAVSPGLMMALNKALRDLEAK